jgi:molybdate transport system regulatory protein
MPAPASTSARNQFSGTIAALTTGAVNTEVVLDIGSGAKLAAIITNSSAKELGLAPGSPAIALFKATWVIISTDNDLKTSARNQFKGTVKSAVPGAVNAEVIVELPSGQSVVAIVTNESCASLGLKPGLAATALVKASHVVIGVK